MKSSEVPAWADSVPATTIPTKTVPDWDMLHLILLANGYVVIESDELRGRECVQVKAFNSHLRLTKNIKLRTKRIGKTRWFCTL